MLQLDKPLNSDRRYRIYAFDLEWTKSYRVKNGNQPFCFSLVWVANEHELVRADERLRFGVIARYVESKEEIPLLLKEADRGFRRFIDDDGGLVLVGHQLCSDIAVLLNHPGAGRLRYAMRVKKLWHGRTGAGPKRRRVFDTRYDLDSSLVRCKSRRLVDVCYECNLDVKQPELQGSMTRMQNLVFTQQDADAMEKLLTLNIRHSLSSLIVYLCAMKKYRRRRRLNVNRIIHQNLSDRISYVQSSVFQPLLRSAPGT